MSVDLDTLNKVELIALAREQFGVNPDTSKSEDELRELLRAAMEDGPSSEDPEPPAPIVPPAAAVAGAVTLDTATHVTIEIPKTDAPMGDADVYVNANGRSFLVRRGEPVEVPVIVFTGLRDAVKKKYRQQPDGSLKEERVLAYPFNVVSFRRDPDTVRQWEKDAKAYAELVDKARKAKAAKTARM